jgi:hypothetical protein
VQTVQQTPRAERTRLPDIQDVAPGNAADPGEQQDQYRRAQPSGADRRAQFRHPPGAEPRSGQTDQQPAKAAGRQPQAGRGKIVTEQHRHCEEASERQQVQVLATPRATPVDQAKHEARRRRHRDRQRMPCERAAGDRRGEPAAALRREPMADRHEGCQQPQPAEERAHQQAKARQSARSI